VPAAEKQEFIYLIKFFFLVKISELSAIVDKVREYFQIDDQYSNEVNLLFLFAKILYLCHLFSVIWYEIAIIESMYDINNWLEK
jgi:hypothetical protein